MSTYKKLLKRIRITHRLLASPMEIAGSQSTAKMAVLQQRTIMIKIDDKLTPKDLLPAIERMWQVSADKIRSIEKTCPTGQASPVFTIKGNYTARGWTEWTQGFQYGSAILQFDATEDQEFLNLGKAHTRKAMAPHLTHIGVHDHGFNNISTYGNLWRLAREGTIEASDWELSFYELALKVSGAVQGARWARDNNGTGYIYTFNGPQSLFIDTIRSCRSLAVSHTLGHLLMGEKDEKINLLHRLVQHAFTTARYNIYYGEGRDSYDTPDQRGRTVHESIFNVTNGDYRCPSTQQGYSPFSTWTRGAAWAMLGFAEQLEFLATCQDSELEVLGGREKIKAMMLKAATATCDWYIQHTPTCGVPYWDAGAPGLTQLGDYQNQPANPFNDYEPVDSSAAAIAAQGLIRLGHYFAKNDSANSQTAQRYKQAGLTVLKTLLSDSYLSNDSNHQGLILHSIYHRPNGWDYIPKGSQIPNGESSMWGDYHAREAALVVQRMAQGKPYYTFFGAQINTDKKAG